MTWFEEFVGLVGEYIPCIWKRSGRIGGKATAGGHNDNIGELFRALNQFDRIRFGPFENRGGLPVRQRRVVEATK